MQIHKPVGNLLEKQYWQSMKNGEASGLEMLYKLYANALYNYGSKFTVDKDLIKECIQELFVNLWTRRMFLNSPPHIKNYLFKSFRLSVFKKVALLKNNEAYEEVENYPFSASVSIEDELIGAEQDEDLKKRLDAAFSLLTDRQREAIFLRFYENLSYDEIAEIMGISVKATYKIMARSLNFLKDNLPKDDLMIFFCMFFMKLFN